MNTKTTCGTLYLVTRGGGKYHILPKMTQNINIMQITSYLNSIKQLFHFVFPNEVSLWYNTEGDFNSGKKYNSGTYRATIYHHLYNPE